MQNISIDFPGRQSVQRVISEFYSSQTAAVIKSSLSMTRIALSRLWNSSVHAYYVFACAIDHSIRLCIRKDGFDHEIRRLPRPVLPCSLAPPLTAHCDDELRLSVRPDCVKQFARVSDVWLDNRKSIWVDGGVVGRSSRQLDGGAIDWLQSVKSIRYTRRLNDHR